MKPLRLFPRRNFDAALAWVRAELPGLFADLDIVAAPPQRWGYPAGTVAMYQPPNGIDVLVDPRMSLEFLVTTLAHEALHAVQWATAGRPEEWRASAADEREAEDFGQAMAAAWRRSL